MKLNFLILINLCEKYKLKYYIDCYIIFQIYINIFPVSCHLSKLIHTLGFWGALLGVIMDGRGCWNVGERFHILYGSGWRNVGEARLPILVGSCGREVRGTRVPLVGRRAWRNVLGCWGFQDGNLWCQRKQPKSFNNKFMFKFSFIWSTRDCWRWINIIYYNCWFIMFQKFMKIKVNLALQINILWVRPQQGSEKKDQSPQRKLIPYQHHNVN